jgi:hypothetical protein
LSLVNIMAKFKRNFWQAAALINRRVALIWQGHVIFAWQDRVTIVSNQCRTQNGVSIDFRT